MSVVANFNRLVEVKGSDAIFHREEWTVPCPCRTPEGFRDPQWHLDHPLDPVCNEEGMLSGNTTHVLTKAFVQPIQSTRATRLSTEFYQQMWGEVQADDHLGIFDSIDNHALEKFKIESGIFDALFGMCKERKIFRHIDRIWI